MSQPDPTATAAYAPGAQCDHCGSIFPAGEKCPRCEPATAATDGVRIEPDAEFPDMLRAYSRASYFGITHGVPYRLLPLWKRFRCPKGRHAWDEVTSGEHYLSCDACDLIVHIRDIEVTHVDGLGMD